MNKQNMTTYRTEGLNVEIAQLYPADWNYKTDDVPEYVRTKFKNSIVQDGSAGVLAVRQIEGRDGYEVMDGNHRLDILTELGTQGIPIENFGLISEAEAITIAARRNHEWYPADPLKWADVLSNTVLKEFSFEALDEFMPQTRDILEQAADLLDRDFGNEGDDDFDVDAALEVEPVSKHGDLWYLGEHRLLCGDSTVKEDVERAMDGERANLCLTDPPYGVNVDYADTDDTPENLKRLISGFLPLAIKICNVVLITCGNSNQHIYPHGDWMMAWFCPAGVGMSRWGFTCWQPILCYGKDPYLAARQGSRPDAFVLQEPASSDKHPCAKPLKVWTWILKRGSVEINDLVYDPFIGSGTTLIACEKLHRKCYGIEISPQYIDVAVNRYVEYVGADENIFCERDGEKIPYHDLFGDKT